jgi:predicted lipoprotein with Yx(FWY)xxD motif
LYGKQHQEDLMRSRLVAVTAAALTLGAAGAAIVSPARAANHSGRAAAGERITAHHSRYGTVIFTGQGRAIYLFARDHGKSACYGACAKAWPPVLTKGRPTAGTGVRAKLLGTVRRTDGTQQVTYAGHPLYRFVNDKKAGEITCQNVSEFGAKWLVLTPAGKAVH